MRLTPVWHHSCAPCYDSSGTHHDHLFACLKSQNPSESRFELSFSTPLQSSRPKRCQCENILLHTSVTSSPPPLSSEHHPSVSHFYFYTFARLNLFSYFLAVIMHVLAHRAIKRMFFVLDNRSPRLTHSCALIRKTHACKWGLFLLYTHPRGSLGGGFTRQSLLCLKWQKRCKHRNIWQEQRGGKKFSSAIRHHGCFHLPWQPFPTANASEAGRDACTLKQTLITWWCCLHFCFGVAEPKWKLKDF